MEISFYLFSEHALFFYIISTIILILYSQRFGNKCSVSGVAGTHISEEN